MLIFRQLFDPQSSTYTYLLGDAATARGGADRPGVRAGAPRRRAGRASSACGCAATLETHVHADHVTGAWLLKQRSAASIALAAASGAAGRRPLPRARRPRRASARATSRCARRPGHTDGCLTYVLDDESMAFTGDCLLIRGSGRTDFQQGDPHAHLPLGARRRSSRCRDDCLLYPGARLPRPHRHQRRRGAALQPAPGRRDRRGRLRRLHEQPRPAAPEADRRRGAGQPALRPARATRPRRRPTRTGRRCTYTFAGIWEIAAARRWRSTRAERAGRRRARARRVHRPARPHPRRAADPAGRARRSAPAS